MSINERRWTKITDLPVPINESKLAVNLKLLIHLMMEISNIKLQYL